jgi:hypothetical protein
VVGADCVVVRYAHLDAAGIGYEREAQKLADEGANDGGGLFLSFLSAPYVAVGGVAEGEVVGL